jgi:hypothetical protein
MTQVALAILAQRRSRRRCAAAASELENLGRKRRYFLSKLPGGQQLVWWTETPRYSQSHPGKRAAFQNEIFQRAEATAAPSNRWLAPVAAVSRRTRLHLLPPDRVYRNLTRESFLLGDPDPKDLLWRCWL